MIANVTLLGEKYMGEIPKKASAIQDKACMAEEG